MREVTINADYAYIEDIDPWLVALVRAEGNQRFSCTSSRAASIPGDQQQLGRWGGGLAEAGVHWAADLQATVISTPWHAAEHDNQRHSMTSVRAAGPWVFWRTTTATTRDLDATWWTYH